MWYSEYLLSGAGWLRKFQRSENSDKLIFLETKEFGKTDHFTGFRKIWSGFYFTDSTILLSRFSLISPLITLIVLISKNHIFQQNWLQSPFFEKFQHLPTFWKFWKLKVDSSGPANIARITTLVSTTAFLTTVNHGCDRGK